MLIEIRIGSGKRKLKSSILKVKKDCKVPSHKIHRVPHITLYGSFHAKSNQINKIKDIIQSVAEKYSFLPYLIDGFKSVDDQIFSNSQSRSVKTHSVEHIFQQMNQ